MPAFFRGTSIISTLHGKGSKSLLPRRSPIPRLTVRLLNMAATMNNRKDESLKSQLPSKKVEFKTVALYGNQLNQSVSLWCGRNGTETNNVDNCDEIKNQFYAL